MYFNSKIAEIEKKIGYTFKDKSLLRQAFTRTSYCNEKNYRGRENYSSNEVLEFFGDSVLSTAIISVLLDKKTERYAHGIKTELTEGDMSNIRSKLSDKRNLSRSMAGLGLHKLLLMGEGDGKLGISDEASVMEDLFESIIGAVYIDCGMNMATVIGVVGRMLDIGDYLNGEAPVQSFKNALQEWCADRSRRLPAPVYKTISETGPDHKKSYERGCYIGDKLWGIGVGKNQKLADAKAAEAALASLKSEMSTSKAQSGAALNELKDYAVKNKLTSPEYHDLGEAVLSVDGARGYVIECSFIGKTVSGIASVKQEAREIAAAKMLELVTKNNSDSKKSKEPRPQNLAKRKKADASKQIKNTGKKSDKAKSDATNIADKQKVLSTAKRRAKPTKVK